MASAFWNRRIAYVLVPLVLLVAIGLVVYFVVRNGNGSEDSPEVTIPQGTLRGANMVTRNNRNVYGFMGIPFAEPPVGNLRFEAPVTAGAWDGTLDASSDSNQCLQLGEISGQLSGDEDCLHLNLYTPQLPAEGNSTLLPVMVYIHGGAFRGGNNDPDSYGPYFLLDKDVILVVPRYRLGIFGFFSTGDEVAPGNNGLKDLVKSLEWIRDNIQYFGGDPNRVTIFGESAGGTIVQLMAISDLTEGLFQQYIAESGSALTFGMQKPRSVLGNRAITLAEYFGCATNTSTAILNCIKEADGLELLNSNSIFAVWNGYPKGIWNPTIEPDIEGAFMSDRPENIFTSGNIRNLRSLTLITQNEGIMAASSYVSDPDSFDTFLSELDEGLPYMLTYDNAVENVETVTAALKSFYFGNLTASRSELLYNLTLLSGDSTAGYPFHKFLQRQLDYTNNTQYMCIFEYLGTFSTTHRVFGELVEGYGATHMDELLYLFQQSYSGLGLSSNDTEMSEADWKMVDTMVELWTSFAINGEPTIEDSSTNVIWEPYTTLKNYLRIGNYSDTSLGVEYGYFAERLQFWEDLAATIVYKET